MQSFFYLFTRYLSERAQAHELSVHRSLHRICDLIFTKGLGSHQIARRGQDRALQRPPETQGLVRTWQAGRSQGQWGSWYLYGYAFVLSPRNLHFEYAVSLQV